jgi:hypothetical protein
VYIVNNMNDPSAGILDNDKNEDGIPDFLYPMRELDLKVMLFDEVEDLERYIKNDTIY